MDMARRKQPSKERRPEGNKRYADETQTTMSTQEISSFSSLPQHNSSKNNWWRRQSFSTGVNKSTPMFVEPVMTVLRLSATCLYIFPTGEARCIRLLHLVFFLLTLHGSKDAMVDAVVGVGVGVVGGCFVMLSEADTFSDSVSLFVFCGMSVVALSSNHCRGRCCRCRRRRRCCHCRCRYRRRRRCCCNRCRCLSHKSTEKEKKGSTFDTYAIFPRDSLDSYSAGERVAVADVDVHVCCNVDDRTD